MFKYQYKYHLVACFQQVDFKTSFGHHLSFVQSLQKLWELLSFSSFGSPASPIMQLVCFCSSLQRWHKVHSPIFFTALYLALNV